VIADGLGLRHVVVGADFCFGKGRAGTPKTSCVSAQRWALASPSPRLLEPAGHTVSSTAIRTALSEGRPRDAARMLGHWHRIDGPVIGGEQRGRDLGYPTANMSIEGLHPPRFGVYAVLVDVLDGPHKGSYHGAASLGVRPMFGENRAQYRNLPLRFLRRSLRRICRSGWWSSCARKRNSTALRRSSRRWMPIAPRPAHPGRA
jgi:riboflavin kinase/FMN adenylyltransferase